MAAVGALLTTNREKRKYGQRTVLTGMRRCEVIERYRLSPERIEWLISKFEGQLRHDTGRNASLDPEIQVGYFPFLVGSSIMHCNFELSRGQRGPFLSLVQVLNVFFFNLLGPDSITILC